jgi:hypothetical protein
VGHYASKRSTTDSVVVCSFSFSDFLVITARHQARNVPGGEQSGDAVDAEDGRPVAICAERESLTSNPLLSVSCSSTSIEATSLRSRRCGTKRMGYAEWMKGLDQTETLRFIFFYTDTEISTCNDFTPPRPRTAKVTSSRERSI